MRQVLTMLFIVLAVITLVGHGIWVAIAAVLRLLNGGPAGRAAPVAGTVCRGCGHVSALQICPRCAADKSKPGAAVGDGGRGPANGGDLAATIRQLDRWVFDGTIDADTHRRLHAIAEVEQREKGRSASLDRVLGREAAPPPVATGLANPKPAAQFDQDDDEAIAMQPVEADEAAASTMDALADAAVAESGYTANEPISLTPPPVPPPVPAARPAASPATSPIATPAPPPARTTPWTEILASFMEESHIRWGEIIGGILIVGCSLALVRSGWGEISAKPLLRFSLFTLVTAGLFGLGFYSHRRWRLPTTSRGLLVIATLLVPLNFLAMAAYSETSSVDDWRITLGQLAAGAVFLGLLWRAGSLLVPGGAVLVPLAVLGPSLLQLLNRAWADDAAQGLVGGTGAAGPGGRPLLLMALSLAPLAIYLGSIGYPLLRAWPRLSISARRGWPLLRLMGLASFAAALPLGLLVHKAGRVAGVGTTLAAVSPVVNLYALPALLMAVFFWRRARRPRLANLRTTATAVGVAGVAIMLAAAGMAWPTPAHLVPIAAIDFALLTLAAMTMVIPLAHLPALLCLVVAALLGANVARGRVAWGEPDTTLVIRALLGATSAYVLCGLPPLLACAAAWLHYAKRRTPDAVIYARTAAGVAVAGLLMVVAWGLGRSPDHGATWALAGYAPAFLAVGFFLRRRVATWFGLVLLLAALAQAMLVRYPVAEPHEEGLRWVLLVFATLTGAGWLATRRIEASEASFARPTRRACKAGLLAAFLVQGAGLMSVATQGFMFHGAGEEIAAALWLAAMALAVGLVAGSTRFFALGQASMTLAAMAVSILVVRNQPWAPMDGRMGLLAPWGQFAFVGALAVSGLPWVVLRLVLDRVARLRPFLEKHRAVVRPAWGPFDQVIIIIALLVLSILVLEAIYPSVANEISRRSIDFTPVDSVRQADTLGVAAWALLALIFVDQAARLWERFRKHHVGLMLVMALVACLLVAGGWRASTAVGAAIRWNVAVVVLLVGAALWNGRRIEALATRAGWPGFPEKAVGLAGNIRQGVCAVATLIVVLLSVLPVSALLNGGHPAIPADGSVFARMGPDAALAGPIVILTLTMLGHAIHLRRNIWAIVGGLGWHLAVTLVAVQRLAADDGRIEGVEFVEILQLNALAAGLFAAGWGLARAQAARVAGILGQPSARAGAERHFAVAALAVVGLLKVVGLVGDAEGRPIPSSTTIAAAAWGAAVLALGVSLLLRPRRGALRGIHSAVPAGVGVILDQFDLPARWLAWWGVGTLSFHALLSVLVALWIVRRSRRDEPTFSAEPEPLGIPDWLLFATRGMALVAAVLAFSCLFTFDSATLHRSAGEALLLRLAGPTLLVAAAVALAMLGLHKLNDTLKGEALAVGAVAALLWAQAWIAPGTPSSAEPFGFLGAVFGPTEHLLDRLVVAMIALGLYGVACVLAPSRLGRHAAVWAGPLRKVALGSLVAAGVALGLTFAGEVIARVADRSMPISLWAAVVVAVALAGAAVGAVVAAVRDDSGLSLTLRKACVYAAEALVVLEIAHLRLTMPWLFGGWVGQFWPIFVMIIAFTGAALSEHFKRRGVEALADPLHRTAAFLPVLPLLAAMIVGSEVVPVWSLFVAASAVYALIAKRLKSFLFSILAIAAGNGALWDLLHHSAALAFARHPQVWLIPPAACVLVAAHLNRLRLGPAKLASIRYACLATIYLGSSVEVFLRGVPQSPWLPLVLARLSVAGVLAGVMFRVRSFLFMGAAFLLVAMVAMVWHASASLGWTWIWWVAGIGLGVAIIALFAYFERRRQVMGEVIRGLRQWDA
ncbi:MAG: hypothetical protein NTW19_20625 [Planctomycetota bacterium]|nr:hypothetical protein [Planctomycetota bacterium]